MALTIYILGMTAVTPNFWGNTQLNVAPTSATAAYGWTVGTTAVTTPYRRGRLGATAVGSDSAVATSYNAGTSGPTKGTSATLTGDSFIAGPFAGNFIAATWTFNWNVRATTVGAVGHVNVRVWKSANADGSSATQLMANTAGATVTLSTSADVNSSLTWSPGALTLNNEYLFFQVEWQETTAGTSASSNVLFHVGTSSSIIAPNLQDLNSHLVQGYTPGVDRNNFDGYLGVVFTMLNNYTFNRIGLRCGTGDTGNHNMLLFISGGAQVGSTTTVNLTGGTVGQFYYSAFPQTTLNAGTTYRLYTQVTSGDGQQWADEGPVALSNNVDTTALISSCYRNGGGANADTNATAGKMYVGVDLDFANLTTLSATQANQTVSAVGKVLVGGTLARTQANQTVAAAGGPRVSGTLSRTQANHTLTASGFNRSIQGTLSCTETFDTLNAALNVDPHVAIIWDYCTPANSVVISNNGTDAATAYGYWDNWTYVTGNAAKTSGRWYIELETLVPVELLSNVLVQGLYGVACSTDIGQMTIPYNSCGIGTSRTAYNGDFQAKTGATGRLNAGDRIGIAIDCNVQESYYSVNGVWVTADGATSDPGTNTNPLITWKNYTTYFHYPLAGMYASPSGSASSTTRIHGGATQLYSPPTGYLSWVVPQVAVILTQDDQTLSADGTSSGTPSVETHLILTYTPGNEYQGLSTLLGMVFVLTTDVTVTQMGMRRARDNTGPHLLSVNLCHTDQSIELVANTTVDLSNGDVGSFIYQHVTPFTLLSGVRYYLCGQFGPSDYASFYYGTAVTLNNVDPGSVFAAYSGDGVYFNLTGADAMYAGVDLVFTPPQVGMEDVTADLNVTLDDDALVADGTVEDSVEQSVVQWGDCGSYITLSNDNLDAAITTAGRSSVRANLAKTSGRWYVEIEVLTPSPSGYSIYVGVADDQTPADSLNDANDFPQCGGIWLAAGNQVSNGFVGVDVSGQTGVELGDRIGIAVDCDAQEAHLSRNDINVTNDTPIQWQSRGQDQGGPYLHIYPWVSLATDYGSVSVRIHGNAGNQLYNPPAVDPPYQSWSVAENPWTVIAGLPVSDNSLITSFTANTLAGNAAGYYGAMIYPETDVVFNKVGLLCGASNPGIRSVRLYDYNTKDMLYEWSIDTTDGTFANYIYAPIDPITLFAFDSNSSYQGYFLAVYITEGETIWSGPVHARNAYDEVAAVVQLDSDISQFVLVNDYWQYYGVDLDLDRSLLPPEDTADLNIQLDDDALAADGTVEDGEVTGDITGDLDVTGDDDALAADGTVEDAPLDTVFGSLDATQDDQSLTALGSLAAIGTLAITENADTFSAAAGSSILLALSLIQADHTLLAATGTGIVAALNASQADQTLAALGAIAVAAALARTQDDQTLAALGAEVVAGDLAVTEQSNTLAGAAATGSTASLGVTQTDETLAATGTLVIGGDLAVTQQSNTLVAAGTVPLAPVTGALAVTQDSHILTSVGAGVITGSVTVTQANSVLTGAAGIGINAILSLTQVAHTFSAAGSVSIGANLVVTEAGDTLSAAGKVPYIGTLSVTQAAQTLSATGNAPLIGRTATLAITQSSQTLAATGALTVRGTLAVTQAAQTLAATGAPVVSGTLAATQANQALAATGLFQIDASVGLPDIAMAGSAGEFTTFVSVHATVTLAGVSLTSQPGNMALTSSPQTRPLGAAASLTVGSMIGLKTVPKALTGASMAGVAGVLTGKSIAATLPSARMTGSAGQISLPGRLNVDMPGVQGNFQAGNLGSGTGFERILQSLLIESQTGNVRAAATYVLPSTAMYGAAGDLGHVISAQGLCMDDLYVETKAVLPSDNSVSLIYSDDKGATWCWPLEQPLGDLGEYLTDIQWQRLGMGRDRVFAIQWSAPCKTSLIGVFVDSDVGKT